MFNQPDTLSFIVGIIVLSSVGLSFIAGAISLGILAMRKIHSGIESVMEKGENDEESK